MPRNVTNSAVCDLCSVSHFEKAKWEFNNTNDGDWEAIWKLIGIKCAEEQPLCGAVNI